MPVTLQVADHASKPLNRAKATSHMALLYEAYPQDAYTVKRFIQSSISTTDLTSQALVASGNGFVRAAFHAYSSHQHLRMRPEDVWFAILSQLGFYVNANAEALRELFVSHEGKREIVVVEWGSLATVDMGVIARRMTALIQDNVKDAHLRDWLMPEFSTTTHCDRAVAAVLMMGTVKEYFSFKAVMGCGIPSVTLLGERRDYEDILARLDKLSELGKEPSQFADLLRPVLRNFIATFDPAHEAASREFWGRIVHETDGGSGPSYLGGWLTAFCLWSNEGECLYDANHVKPRRFHCEMNPPLVLDGIVYHQIDTDDIPPGCSSVPVLVNDNGTKFNTKMIAGSLGIQVTNSESENPQVDGRGDTLQSLSGWMMYEVRSENRESQ
ncbi:hypothetical protein ACJQWK_10017 [Exserohilum turcicum]|uniref:Uncharacterized protein n=1 Tax=Exserohilum turcicum (strain 28A) TaxID=671987 RepID=R0I5D7_EXST2|nr:uncharacterized protein SETTUDRAFT_100156 [Exserohilum turcica Et28A]EOA80870.1 hypothetical protein SETTUDRAFT_100156 [Exserohilum turcica Et28A]